MSANKRPHINIAVVRGLRSIISLVELQLNNRPTRSEWAKKLTEQQVLDAERGLTYLQALCDWFEKPHAI